MEQSFNLGKYSFSLDCTFANPFVLPFLRFTVTFSASLSISPLHCYFLRFTLNISASLSISPLHCHFHPLKAEEVFLRFKPHLMLIHSCLCFVLQSACFVLQLACLVLQSACFVLQSTERKEWKGNEQKGRKGKEGKERKGL